MIDERTSAPVTLARVEVERSLTAGASVVPLRASALTDDDGTFEIAGVEPGRCSIHAYALDHVPRAISGLEVVEGADAGPVEIALRPGAEGVGERFDFVGIGVMVRVDDFGEAVQALRGREGTEVLLQVERDEGEPFEVIVIRSRLQG